MILQLQKVNVVKKKFRQIFFFFPLKKKKTILDASCPSNKCLSGGQCSTRLNGIFNCQCLPGYFGNTCQTSYFFFPFFLPFAFFLIFHTYQSK